MDERGSLIRDLEAATHDVGLRRHQALADLKLDQAQMHVLSLLAARGALPVKAIHASFGHRPSTVTDILDRLERRGLVTRSINAADRRSLIVDLTGAGDDAARRVLEATDAIESDVRERLGDDGFESLRRGLAAMRTGGTSLPPMRERAESGNPAESGEPSSA